MYLIKVKDDFCAAHFLKWQNGKQEELHGHNWSVEVCVKCAKLDADGLGIDYLFIYDKLHELLNENFDHKNLNLQKDFNNKNPSSENIAKWIYDKLSKIIEDKRSDASIYSVTIAETNQFAVTFMPKCSS